MALMEGAKIKKRGSKGVALSYRDVSSSIESFAGIRNVKG